jgi:hypothetical protein
VIYSAEGDEFSWDLFKTLEEHGHNLRELDLQQDDVDVEKILGMPTVLGQITSLRLCQEYHDGIDTDRIPEVLETLGRLCSNLRHLDLQYYNMYESIVPEPGGLGPIPDGKPGLYRDDIEALLSGLKASLISLKIGDLFKERRDELQVEQSPFIHCTMLEKLKVGYGVDAKDINAISRLGNLKELEIGDKAGQIKDKDYQDAFEQKQLINLRQFVLHTQSFGTKAVIALLRNCPNLTSFSCPSNGNILEGIREIVADCGSDAINLQKLYLNDHGLTMNELIALTSLCNLRELRISGNYFSKPIFTIANYNVGVTTIPKVNLLNLEVLDLGNFCNLDSEMFKTLVEGCPKLKHVKLNNLPEVTSWLEIFKECNLKNLETFQARDCPGIRGPDLVALNQNCPKIKKIFLPHFHYLWSSQERKYLLDVAKQQSDLAEKLQVPDNYKSIFSKPGSGWRKINVEDKWG